MSSVANDKIVRAVAKTANKNRLRASPACRLVADPEVQGAALVGPDVIRIVEIIESPASRRDSANLPVITAEAQWHGGQVRQRSGAIHYRQCHHSTTDSRRYIDGWRGMIVRIHEQGSVLVSQVRLRAPGRIGLDRYKWLFWPRLYPPRATLCINNNSLSQSSPGDATRDRI